MAQVCPKCGAENADSEYFCAECHVHIRSAFGAPQVQSSPPAAVTTDRPKSIFATPVAVAEAEPETGADSSSNGEGAYAGQEQSPAGLELVASEEVTVAQEAQVAAEPPAEQTANAEPEQTLSIVTDGTRIEWNLSRSVGEVHSELREILGIEERVAHAGKPDSPSASTVPAPPDSTAAKPPDPVLSVYDSLRRSAGPYVKLPAPEALAPQPPDVTVNTSGQGAQSVLPLEASGWSWAGFVPLGAFAFSMGLPWLGVLGLLGLLTGRFGLFYLWPVYMLVVGLRGRELAWRTKRFGSVAQYVQTQESWNSIGKLCVVVDIIIYLLFIAVGAAIDGA